MERADAAHNRARILEAAALLFAERPPQDVTMDDIAKKAGVGRGTLYRRYPDRASIAVALLDDHERELQERLLRGDPPLGPGAPPAERLAAFYAAMVRLLEDHSHLVLGSEVGRSRFETGAYGFWRAHVRALLSAAGTPGPDALVEVLLAPLAPEVYGYQRRVLGLSPEQIARALARLTRMLDR
ncbi:TetR/AcrR family transcriptional regulator [Nonomuraea glycinis]|uniref:TetR family transcriptional regulator n=1 Tax=Nonomuraea glycinis TaxID=2047744 RepID=A0A918E7G5_9ACTN|nr:TetR/AcrR family transcriptional regulator [Nonomuraea glycinis]MCA2177478.1 TetR/AcrR family transcriptional regulator [Nonomuraea glycinis]GGP09384.1 TetR family transcriptional regulator [Nonomuraea glycinis]